MTVALLGAATFVAVMHTLQLWQVQRRVESVEDELTQLADEILPVAARRLREGESVTTISAETPNLSNDVSGRIFRQFVKELGVSEHQREAAMSACANAAGRMQAMAVGMLADLREMEYRHNEDVLGDLGLSVGEAASRLGISRVTLSRVLHGHARVSPNLAVRLEEAGVGTARAWLAMQSAHDLAAERAAGLPKVRRLETVA